MNQSENKKLFEALFHSATEGIILCKKDGTILLANAAGCSQFGYEKDELNGKMIETLIPHRFRAGHRQSRAEYNDNPSPRKMGQGRDLYGIKKDGTEFPVEVSLSPATIDGTDIIIAFTIDISKRKMQEQQIMEKQKELELVTQRLKQVNEQLEKKVADRTSVLREALSALEKSKNDLQQALSKERELNELKSRFLSMASHEFRTPLTAILSSASLINEYKDTESQDKREKHVKRITVAVNSLNDILSDFLSISKIEEGKISAELRNFPLAELLSETESELKAMLKANQKLIIRHHGKQEICSDRKLIRQILINLLSNAIKYSDEGKEIRLVAGAGEKELKLEVSDQGIGISKEDQKHLFERFYRGSNAGNIQGTGLGLNIVAGYVELLDGIITFESELNKGTTFFVTIPLTK